MASGLKQIRQELGPDALILSTRTVRNGKLGILGKPVLEITAAIDTDFSQSKKSEGEYSRDKTNQHCPTGNKGTGFRKIVDDPVENYLNTQPPSKAVSGLKEKLKENQAGGRALDDGLQSEVIELKDLVKDLAMQVTRLTEKESAEKEHKQSALQVRDTAFAKHLTANSIHGDHILSMLVDRGINVETSRTITGFLRQSLTEKELLDPENVTKTIVSTIQDLIEVQIPVFEPGQPQQRIALVGPTGVGKTTTLAKLAASYLSRVSPSIALITIDTYRIAAVEQLKVYGEIMHLPVDVVISPEQLEQAIARHQDKELILIDTAGRSPRDSYCIDELASFLKPELHIDKHLVLSAGTRENELLDTIERFSTLGISNTIFTKIDECSSLGILLNIQIQNPNPLSYVTNGQRVPEDLLEISPKTVAELIMSQHEGSMHG